MSSYNNLLCSDNARMIEIAHRGYSKIYKDNSMKAFRAAVYHKFDIIKLDVTLTKDNEIIVYHDMFIGDKLIRYMTANEVKSRDPEIITLHEFFEQIDCSKQWIFIDVKGNDEYICIHLHNILQELPDTNRILIGSSNTMIINRLHSYTNNYYLGIITENVLTPNMIQRYIDLYDIKFVCFHWTALNHIVVRYMQMKIIFVFTNTCQNETIRKFMSEFSPDGIVTNYKLYH